jgi:hypothetical protein
LAYLEDRGLDEESAVVLESLGRIKEAAEAHLAKGNAIDAIRLFLSDKDNDTSQHRALECAVQIFWEHCSLGVSTPDVSHDRVLHEALDLATKLNSSTSEEAVWKEVRARGCSSSARADQ